MAYNQIEKDDFIYLPADVLHAMRKGSIVKYSRQQILLVDFMIIIEKINMGKKASYK